MASAFLAPMPAGPSMGICGVTVPNEVIGHVLASSPDFDTLHASLGVCSTWNRAFETQPASILLSVARDVVGPALPQAVRFIRYPYPEKIQNDWVHEDDEAEEDPEATEDDSDEEGKPAKAKTKVPKPKMPENTPIGKLTPEERMRLQKNAGTVGKLEEIFSLRHKKANQLTALESHRFARAMYRVMLYCELFYLPLNLDDIDAMEDNEPGVLAKIQNSRLAMLDEYSTSHLLEIRAVVEFLHEMIAEVLDDEEFERLKDICLATGPAVVLKAYIAKSSDVFEEALELEMMTSGEDNELYGGLFSKPLEKIWKKRKVVPPVSEMDAILEEIVPKIDACAQCGKVDELWSEANWANRISVDFCTLLEGKLNSNEVETEALVEILMSPTGTADIVIAEIYDMLTPDFTSWKKEESLCSACLEKLVTAHLHLWLHRRKISGGWKKTQNCWYGYDCNTQVHKTSHAREKNHLCKPTR
ncbi:hypothetical protein MSAN_02274100 [Mycena sanguinolenta]|uniref:Uncharacterized protein n=1 Tax=Mycena sanguinolenta TaxID=230812 RepID=A0A8H6XA30_9AGAR|nr:hypothetical protein MSAN_02274100 [Mycena sanguinolenta]